MRHIGSYDDEPQSFEQMKKFIKENKVRFDIIFKDSNIILNILKVRRYFELWLIY